MKTRTNHPLFRNLSQSINWQPLKRLLLLQLLLMLGLSSSGCFESKVVTSKVNDTNIDRRPNKMNGIFYALPRTVVRADIPVVRIDKEPGEFVEYIKCFFPNLKDDDYIQASSTEFKIAADKVRFDTGFVPDLDEVYLIKTQGGMFETRNLELELTESGVLVKASAETTNEMVDIVTGGIKTAVGLVAKASVAQLLSKGPELQQMKEKLPFEQQQCWNRLEEKLDADAERAASKLPKPLSADEKVRNRQIEAAMDQSLLRSASDFIKAQDAFEQISALEQQRNDLLRATDIPLETLKLMIDELDKRIENYRSAFFFGTKTTLVWNPTFKLNPDDNRTSIDVFSISQSQGVCDVFANKPPNNQGVPFDSRFKLKGDCSGDTVRLEVIEGEDGEGGPGDKNYIQFGDRVKHLRTDGTRGFYYRIPGRAVALVTRGDEKKELGRAPVAIAQFGQVVSLPASTGGRKTKYTLALYEASGGLKNFVMGSDSLVKQKNIDDLSGAVETAIEAKGERKKAKDELQQLERQRKILEERKKIRDLEKELQTVSPNQ